MLSIPLPDDIEWRCATLSRHGLSIPETVIADFVHALHPAWSPVEIAMEVARLVKARTVMMTKGGLCDSLRATRRQKQNASRIRRSKP